MLKQEESDGMAEQALHSFSHHTDGKPIVLIADDSRVVRVSLKNILKDDCQLFEAEDGQQAWEILLENPSVAMIFSDLSMPKLDGRGLLAKIRTSENESLAKLPFVVVTGNEESPEIRQELQRLGANEIVNKPFDPSNITAFVAALVCPQQEEKSQLSHDVETQSEFLENVADRAHFMECTSRELSFAIRNKNELAIALVKIDQFAEIVSLYSESAIDHILHSLVEIVRQHIHPDDILAYFGEGLIAILRPASNAIGTRYIGRRILEDLASKQFYLGESEQVVSASIAISAPDIKPGTRLKDLLSLAEGRLKAAMDNGGNKVVDKGNGNLTPVSLSADTSELINPSILSNDETTNNSSLSLTRSPTEIHRLAAEHVAQIKAKYGNDLTGQDDQISELVEHEQTIERLMSENRQLIDEVARWKKQSTESEHLRRQLFEVESQQQQMQIKLNELQDSNQNFQQRAESAEHENHVLINEEETRTSSIKQTQQFIEDENRRLEQRTTELVNRAEKAELENRKSDQLVNSLKDNIKLLHMQLEQLQKQIEDEKETQKQLSDNVNKIDANSAYESVSQLQHDSKIVNDAQSSGLTLNAMPMATPSTSSEPPTVHLFPEQDQVQSKRQSTNNTKIPPFRIEPEPFLFKNGLHLSSFAIASIILVLILSIAGIYIFLVMDDDPSTELSASNQAASTNQPQPILAIQTGLEPGEKERSNLAENPVKTHVAIQTKNQPHAQKSGNRETTVSDEIRLEKELTLRRMAEEEFSIKAQ
ncbi:MAG: response regulator [Candidatus Thiodiazotropha sp.]|nr:response regulator [Candidatus Thiodiazotropha sp.]MCM8882422.1 response regulator [Candidatus Thiodiazotropha sp.]MCM8918638.1 response regulator [Candidatus Thiodiazotropha sp.]